MLRRRPLSQPRADDGSLIYAADREDLAAVRLLIASGADVDYENDAGDTPLNCAVAAGALQIVEALIEAGADVNARNRFHVTPMAYAGDHPEVARVLFEAGAKPHDPDEVTRLTRRDSLIEKLVVVAFLAGVLSLLAIAALVAA